MNWFLNRLREPSTWSGLAVLGGLLGAPVGSIDLVHQLIVAVMGLAAVAMPESKPAAPVASTATSAPRDAG